MFANSGPDSLFERLKKNGVDDPNEYITFHGLRTWSELHGDLVLLLFYVKFIYEITLSPYIKTVFCLFAFVR